MLKSKNPADVVCCCAVSLSRPSLVSLAAAAAACLEERTNERPPYLSLSFAANADAKPNVAVTEADKRQIQRRHI